ncbi:MAG: DUF4271 domain-containing protein [Bacteroidales bacterium]|nr:DUF4271 domain-containing protein [Bacteroidales bacterium]
MEEFFHSVAECWPGSVLHEFSQNGAVYEPYSHDWWLVGAALVTFLLFLVFFNQVIAAVSTSFSVFFSGMSPKNCYKNQYTTSTVNLTTIIALLAIDLVVYMTGLSSLSFFFIPVSLIALILIRYLICGLFIWLRGNAEMWRMVKAVSKVSIIVCAILLIPVIILRYFIPPDVSVFIKWYTLAIFCIVYLIYIVKSVKILYTSGCSLFFLFLYLCALEFLPIGFFVSAFVRL